MRKREHPDTMLHIFRFHSQVTVHKNINNKNYLAVISCCIAWLVLVGNDLSQMRVRCSHANVILANNEVALLPVVLKTWDVGILSANKGKHSYQSFVLYVTWPTRQTDHKKYTMATPIRFYLTSFSICLITPLFYFGAPVVHEFRVPRLIRYNGDMRLLLTAKTPV